MDVHFKFDKTKVKIIKQTEQTNDFAYWQSQSDTKRLMALEKLGDNSGCELLAEDDDLLIRAKAASLG